MTTVSTASAPTLPRRTRRSSGHRSGRTTTLTLRRRDDADVQYIACQSPPPRLRSAPRCCATPSTTGCATRSSTARWHRARSLRDTELAAWLGVSRTPVREALLRLGETGLVRAAPGRSTVVAEIDLAEVRDAHAVVAAMHRLAVAEAVARLTPGDLDADARGQRALRRAPSRSGTPTPRSPPTTTSTPSPSSPRGNRALATVLDQFSPVVRRLERLRFASHAGEESVGAARAAGARRAPPATSRPPPRSPSAPGRTSPT